MKTKLMSLMVAAGFMLVAFAMHIDAQDARVRIQKSAYYPTKGEMSVTHTNKYVIPYLLYKSIREINIVDKVNKLGENKSKNLLLANSQIDFRGLAALCVTGAAFINRKPLMRSAFKQYRKLLGQ